MDRQKGDYTLFKMRKRTNRDIKYAGFLNIVHILQHQTSCPTAKSAQTTIVSTAKWNFLLLVTATDAKSTSPTPDEILRRMKARADCNEKQSKYWGHCAVFDLR
jgi:hypothetical protein